MRVHFAIESFLTYCTLERNLSKLTLRAYTVDLDQFKAFVGMNTPIEECGTELLRGYIRYLLENLELKPASVKRKMACLKSMFAWLHEGDMISANPFYKMRVTIKLPTLLPKALTPEEMRALLKTAGRELNVTSSDAYAALSLEQFTCSRDFTHLTTLLALELLLNTGIRVGELESTTLPEVDIKSSRIKIFGKGSRERNVYLTNTSVKHLLKLYLKLRKHYANGDHSLLIHADGRPITASTIRRRFKSLGVKAKLSRPVTPHMLRHTAATFFLEAGVDIRYVQQLLGHQSISTTQIYTHVTDRGLQKALLSGDFRRNL